MVIDTSALLAVMQNEPERRRYLEGIEAADTRLMSVATFVETSIVLEVRYGADGLRDLDLFLGKAGVELVAVDSEQAHIARRAYSRFGRGRHHAALNYGDCFSYALATVKGEPLLYKGDDFVHTDVRSVEFAMPEPSPTDDASGVRDAPSADLARTQPVTQADIEGGRIRIPSRNTNRAKSLLPQRRTRIQIQLRTHEQESRYDPHYDSDRERSGIISVKHAALSRLVAPNERLNVSLLPDGTICLD
jgi:ribonuclease VapC